MPVQVAIMKVLSNHPQGFATVAEMHSDLAILISSDGWADRMKRIAARAPDLDIFGHGLVLRDCAGWHLTKAGRDLLASMEAPTSGVDVAFASGLALREDHLHTALSPGGRGLAPEPRH